MNGFALYRLAANGDRQAIVKLRNAAIDGARAGDPLAACQAVVFAKLAAAADAGDPLATGALLEAMGLLIAELGTDYEPVRLALVGEAVARTELLAERGNAEADAVGLDFLKEATPQELAAAKECRRMLTEAGER